MIEKKEVSNCIKRVCLLLAGLQVLLGIIWLVGNVSKSPGSVLTVLIAIVSYRYFLKQFMGDWLSDKGGKSLYIWSTYIAFFPTILHGHVCAWRYSLTTSLLLVLLADLVRLYKEEEEKKILLGRMALAWFLAGVFVPAYGVIIGIVLLPSLFVYCKKRRIGVGIVFLTIVLAVSGLATGYYVDFESGGKPRIQNSISSVLLSRFAWPYFVRNSYFWEPEVRELFSDSDLAYISTYPELVQYDFGPKLEARVGKARAREIYRKMAWDSFQIGKKEAILGLGRDLVANAGGPVAVQYQLAGNGISYTGMNYADMRAEMPGFTKYFVRFSFYSFDFMALLSLVILIGARIRGKWHFRCRKNIFLLTLVSILVFWYSMVGNGMQNYLKIMPVNVAWCLLPILGYGLLRGHKEDTPSSEKV